MNIFLSGTDTHVGKTTIASWIALHTGFAYFKPIQTGTKEGTDSQEVEKLSHAKIYPECYTYTEPLSPHAAAILEGDTIIIQNIILPQPSNMIIEGAGGVLVPINHQYLMIDLIQHLKAPVILVARTCLGTINHTLLSLEALRSRNIPVLGVIMNGHDTLNNSKAIAWYGRTTILAKFPRITTVHHDTLKKIALPQTLKQILYASHDTIAT
jgi:dethiobiotin synthetase